MLADPDTRTVVPLPLHDRAPVPLEEVLAGAARLTRVDRKYLVPVETAATFVAELPASYRVLTVDGRQVTTYRSTYFDTADLACCRAHVQQRRRRWKARSRLYVEDGLCRVEVKSKDGRGVTEKAVSEEDAGEYGRLGHRASAFVGTTLVALGLDVDVTALRPTAEVGYRRVTLADTSAEACRVTIDHDVVATLGAASVRLADDHVLVETKAGPRPSEADRLLVSLGARPRSFSKYVSAASLLHEDLADNDVRHLLGRQLLLEGPVVA